MNNQSQSPHQQSKLPFEKDIPLKTCEGTEVGDHRHTPQKPSQTHKRACREPKLHPKTSIEAITIDSQDDENAAKEPLDTLETAAIPDFHRISDINQVSDADWVVEKSDRDTFDPPKYENHIAPVKSKRKLWLWIPLGLLSLAVIGYLTFVFVPIPFIRNLRDGYIGTAMTTADHQWLATAFIPRAIIDDVMGDIINPPEREDDTDLADLIIKKPETSDKATDTQQTSPNTKEETSVSETDTNPSQLPPENDILKLSAMQVGDTDYAGYTVTHVDMEEGLFISKIKGSGFQGYAMLIDDPARVFVGTTPEKNNRGYRILEMMDSYDDVIAGINASGFADPNDSGRGCDIIGFCMSEGEEWGTYTNTMASIVLTDDNKLVAGWISNWSQYNIRDGMQFGPVLIKNGENQIEGGGGYGWHPRTAIGQREDGAIIMIVIDGRVAASLGCQVGDLASIMLEYGAVNAGCCDGGSSVVLAYDGAIINENSSANPEYGRRIPNAFLVRSKKETATS